MKILIWTLLLLPICAWASSSAETHRIHGEWECRLGPAWIGKDSWSGPYPGYVFFRPGPEPFPSISVEKFIIGNKLYSDSRAFFKHFAGSAEGIHGAGPAQVAQQRVTVWERRYQEKPSALERADSAGHPIIERFVILEGKKSFFVLRWKVSPMGAAGMDNEFKGFLSSFHFLNSGIKGP